MSNGKKRKDEPKLALIPIRNDNLQHQAESQEPRLISICIKHKHKLEECVRRGVTVESFIEPKCRVIYGMLAKYFDKYNATMSRDTFGEEAAKEFPASEVGSWRSEFDSIWRKPTNEDDFASLINDLEGRYLQQQAYTVCSTYFDKFLNGTEGQKDLVEVFQRHVSRIKSHSEMAYVTSSTLDEATDEVWKEIMLRREKPGSFKGLMSGFKCMDQVFHGFNRGKYMVILAMEGGGKTTYMLNLAINMVGAGMNVAYVTVESDLGTTSKRLMTIRSKVDYNRISLGGSGDRGLNDYTIEQLSKARDEFLGDFGKRFHWIQAMQGTPQNMIIEELNKKLSYTKLDVVFVDYLDVIGPQVKYPDRPDLELADVSANFQNYGTAHNILMITAQQLKTDKVREMSGKHKNAKNQVTGETFSVGVGDVSGSKKIAGAADYIFALFVDPNSACRMYVQAVKARNNRSQDKFALAYDRDSGRLEDLLPDSSGYESIADEISTNPVFKQAAFEQSPEAESTEQPQMQTALGYVSTDVPADFVEWDPLDRGIDFWSGE